MENIRGGGDFSENIECDEILFVLSGGGTFEIQGGAAQSFSERDVIFVPKNTIYRFINTNAEFVISMNPPFNVEQHKTVSVGRE